MVILAPDMQVFERGWLSANNILFDAGDGATLIDTGYCTHAAQTLALVDHALAGRPLARIVNTHLHSDHCGGNAALQARYPAVRTLIPPGQSTAVAAWDEEALTYQATGQQCPRFAFDALVYPGDEITLGAQRWQVLAAPGHDPHSVVLYGPQSRILISADALWENGFGVVFPELEGEQAFADVAATLGLIEKLHVDLVVPGHGAPFTDCAGALARAYARLNGQMRDPAKHAWHAAKVLVMYRMMAEQRIAAQVLQNELARATLFQSVARRWFGNDVLGLISRACNELIQKGQLLRDGEQLVLA
jgi:glyoxylase-like metal-dependent hydrolase (beta-lactamase superfamily II)